VFTKADSGDFGLQHSMSGWMGSRVEELACRRNLSRPLCSPGLFWTGLSVPFKTNYRYGTKLENTGFIATSGRQF
jgi:hypothetical protein